KAGKLFGTNAATADAAKDAAAAVGAVSGKQILSAIVAAAGSSDQTGKKADTAKNEIAAAIGSTAEENAAEAFNKDEMKKNDQIALTSFIVLPLILLLYILFSFKFI
ncbi:variable large family protein, partial [Borreliella garinii]|uniref:variable large family protein n=1 Tax=Borreliella garinii TaxID=29519 RepID=UPI001AF01B8B